MGDVGYLGWAFAVFFYVLMAGNSWYAGIYTNQVFLRLGHRQSRESFQKWGVEDELLRYKNLKGFIVSGILILFFLLFTFVAALFSAVLVTETSPFDSNQILFTFYVFIWAFLLGYFAEMTRTGSILQKVRKLDNLKDVFHRCFTPSEILSMHESLLSGPPIIWEEYASLPEEEIGHETNDKYRRLVEPYRHRQSTGHNRTMVVLTTIALLIAATGVMTALWDVPA